MASSHHDGKLNTRHTGHFVRSTPVRSRKVAIRWPRNAYFCVILMEPALEFAMRHVLPCTFFLGVLLAVPTATEAQNLGTAFTYQGELKAAGEAAQGLFDFEACLFDTPVIPNSMPLLCVEQANRPVGGDGQGRFTLSLDFGAAFDGSVRYLEIRVRPAGVGGTFTALLPRHEIRPTPEALRAASAP